MKFRIKLATGLLIWTLLGTASSVLAQQKGQWVPGQFGLNAGVIPDPGVTYANMALNYSASQLYTRPSNGNRNLPEYDGNLFVLGG